MYGAFISGFSFVVNNTPLSGPHCVIYQNIYNDACAKKIKKRYEGC